MAGSVIVAVRKALIAGLDALTATGQPLEGFGITYAWNPKTTDRYRLFTAHARAETPPAAIKAGRNHRDETATFVVVLEVEVAGADADEAEQLVADKGQVFEEWLADRKSNELDVTGLNWIRAVSWELNGSPSDRSYLAQLIYTIRYNARLT